MRSRSTPRTAARGRTSSRSSRELTGQHRPRRSATSRRAPTTRSSRPTDPGSTRSRSARASGARSCSRRWRSGVLVATVPQLGIPVLPRSRRAEQLGTDLRVRVPLDGEHAHDLRARRLRPLRHRAAASARTWIDEIRRARGARRASRPRSSSSTATAASTRSSPPGAPARPRRPRRSAGRAGRAVVGSDAASSRRAASPLVQALLDGGCRGDRPPAPDDGEADAARRSRATRGSVRRASRRFTLDTRHRGAGVAAPSPT